MLKLFIDILSSNLLSWYAVLVNKYLLLTISEIEQRGQLARSILSAENILTEKIGCPCYPIDRGTDKAVAHSYSHKKFSEIEKYGASSVSKGPDESCFT